MFATSSFTNKNVLVTGGGTGIGFEISKLFLQQNAQVFITSRNEEKLKKAIEELSKFGNCNYFVTDIRQPEQIETLAQTLKEQDKSIDILVNNAGGQFLAPAETISINGWNSVINNNLNGTWYMSSLIAKHFFIPEKKGNIINIIANIFRGFPGMVHTGAARAGVDNMTKTLAVEWSKYKIRVNAIAPGVIYSSGLDNYPAIVKEMTLQEVPKRVPLKRLGKPEEVAYLALFLASEFAEYITGETIYVDGGQHLWGDTWQL
ncbi:MAG: SDR family oxidoreductase [Cytophagales bacterium]|nr:MAG: SDR family oxidoreductase [Cytophagales bacterium]